MARGGNPLMKKECPECRQKYRHAETCSKKRKSGPRGMTREKMVEIIRNMTDDAFGQLVSLVVGEAEERRQRIEEEAAERLKKLDAILPTPGRVVLGKPKVATEPDVYDYDGPSGVCSAIYPEDPTVKCTQETKKGQHFGEHYNRNHKIRWAQRNPPKAS